MLADDLCRYAGNGAVCVYTFEHNTARTNSRTLADGNVSEQLSVSADKNATADFRVTIAACFSSTSKRNAVQHRYVVTHDGGLADHDASRMVDKDARADPRRRVNVDAKDFANSTLNVEGQRSTVARPQRVRDSVGLNR